MPKLKLKTTLHRQDIKGAWTYCVIRDAAKIFGLSSIIPVKGTIDNLPIEAILTPHSDGSHWLAIKKEWRLAINKSIGDPVELFLEDVKDDPIPALKKSVAKKETLKGKLSLKTKKLFNKNKANKK